MKLSALNQNSIVSESLGKFHLLRRHSETLASFEKKMFQNFLKSPPPNSSLSVEHTQRIIGDCILIESINIVRSLHSQSFCVF